MGASSSGRVARKPRFKPRHAQLCAHEPNASPQVKRLRSEGVARCLIKYMFCGLSVSPYHLCPAGLTSRGYGNHGLLLGNYGLLPVIAPGCRARDVLSPV